MDETNTDFREEKRKSLDDILRKGLKDKEVYKTLFTKGWEKGDFETLAVMEYALKVNSALEQVVVENVWSAHGFVDDALTETGKKLAPRINTCVNNEMARIQQQAEMYCNQLVFGRTEHLPHEIIPRKVQDEMCTILSGIPEINIIDFSERSRNWMARFAVPLFAGLRDIKRGVRVSGDKTPSKKYVFIDPESRKLLDSFKTYWKQDPEDIDTKRTFTLLLAHNRQTNPNGTNMDDLRHHLVDTIAELGIDPTTYVKFLVSVTKYWQQINREYTEENMSAMLYGALGAISVDWYEMPEGIEKPKQFFKHLFSFIVSVSVNIDIIRRIMDLWTSNKDIVLDVLDVLYNKPIYCAQQNKTICIPTNYVNEGCFRIQEYLIRYIETFYDFDHTFKGADVENYRLLFPHLWMQSDGFVLLNSYHFAEKHYNGD